MQALNVEGRKITEQQIIAETFNEYFVGIAENVKRKIKNNLINDDNNSFDNHTLWNNLLINLTQVWNVSAQQKKKLNKF